MTKQLTRAQIKRKIHSNSERIKSLKERQIELNREHLLLSDKNQWYKEVEMEVGRDKNKVKSLMGIVYWKEKFVDEDNPKEFVVIERSCAVRRNNEWINGY